MNRALSIPVAVLGLVLVPLALVAQQSSYPQIDSQIEDAVQTGLIPGAVFLVGRNGHVLYRKAYGSKALLPTREPMTVDTIFDAASLTKVIATTSCVMKLFEQGKIRLDDPVTKYLPDFQGGKSEITVRNLMTHFSGFRPDLDLKPRWSGYETGINKALNDTPTMAPGQRFVYSDINFLLMGEIVRRLSGKMMPEFARDEIFLPLGMADSQFNPPPSLRPRIAPTEIDPDTNQLLRGVVHDPTSRYMGGVAGNAGLFTTADDLAKFAGMMLNSGEHNGTRIFSPLTIRKFTEPASPADQPILRGLGWDIDSPYSSNRGELYPIGSFGHTGYTGTSLWLDPSTQSFVILLTNVVHPHGVKSLTSLRSKVATAVAASFGIDVQRVTLTGYNETITGAGIHRVVARNAKTLTGLDVLAADGFSELKGKRVGLITNQTGLDRNGHRNMDLMLSAGVEVTKLFSPEHGIAGMEDTDVANSKDPQTGLPVVSLFAPNQRRLTATQMRDLDAIVFDIQDIGARFWTYSCTMLYAVEEAAKAKKPFFLLDRPNPITGTHVEGPVLDTTFESFVGCYNIPTRHGMTFGELATMANDEQHWNADLHVIKLKDWQRGDWFDSTSLAWVNPSPNMRTLNEALLYPGVAMLEASKNYSVGRGTDAPFEQIGADWIEGMPLAAYLNSRFIPGVRFYPVKFKPVASNFAGHDIEGIRFVITDRESFDSTRLGLELATALDKLFPGHLVLEKSRALIGNQEILLSLAAHVDASTVVSKAQAQALSFTVRRRPYLLY